MVGLNKTYVISLPGGKIRAHWEAIASPDLVVWDACDTRESSKDMLSKYKLEVSPTGPWMERHGPENGKAGWKWEEYFDRFPGGVGCYLSHWLIWNEIKNSKPGWYLVLEEDALIEDAINFISNGISLNSQTNIVKLNKRPCSWCGTEAYLVNNQACETLINITGTTITAPVDAFMFREEDVCWNDSRLKHEHHKMIGLDSLAKKSQIQI